MRRMLQINLVLVLVLVLAVGCGKPAPSGGDGAGAAEKAATGTWDKTNPDDLIPEATVKRVLGITGSISKTTSKEGSSWSCVYMSTEGKGIIVVIHPDAGDKYKEDKNIKKLTVAGHDDVYWITAFGSDAIIFDKDTWSVNLDVTLLGEDDAVVLKKSKELAAIAIRRIN